MGFFKNEWIVKKLITIAGKGAYDKIRKAAQNPEYHQKKFLLDLLKEHSNTVFGQEHDFSKITSYEEYKRVPLRKYNDYDKYIEMILDGKSDVLFSGRPVVYNTSSGTTGKVKLIPISGKFAKSLSKFNKIWMYSILEHNPQIFDGKSISSVGKAIEDYARDGVPIGSIFQVIVTEQFLNYKERI
ncbi:MAG: GH3 auxin-responsive promoter family protein [Bacteroidales bacterium]|nr:GH3 auxin-responsive promoter family protein [Bacteroidales bacterium]